jgi:transcriptional regulator of acetoin/glycerol metabolism
VRELNNVLERAILLCDDTVITLDDLPESISGTVAASPDAGPASDPRAPRGLAGNRS